MIVLTQIGRAHMPYVEEKHDGGEAGRFSRIILAHILGILIFQGLVLL